MITSALSHCNFKVTSVYAFHVASDDIFTSVRQLRYGFIRMVCRKITEVNSNDWTEKEKKISW